MKKIVLKFQPVNADNAYFWICLICFIFGVILVLPSVILGFVMVMKFFGFTIEPFSTHQIEQKMGEEAVATFPVMIGLMSLAGVLMIFVAGKICATLEISNRLRNINEIEIKDVKDQDSSTP